MSAYVLILAAQTLLLLLILVFTVLLSLRSIRASVSSEDCGAPEGAVPPNTADGLRNLKSGHRGR